MARRHNPGDWTRERLQQQREARERLIHRDVPEATVQHEAAQIPRGRWASALASGRGTVTWPRTVTWPLRWDPEIEADSLRWRLGDLGAWVGEVGTSLRDFGEYLTPVSRQFEKFTSVAKLMCDCGDPGDYRWLHSTDGCTFEDQPPDMTLQP